MNSKIVFAAFVVLGLAILILYRTMIMPSSVDAVESSVDQMPTPLEHSEGHSSGPLALDTMDRPNLDVRSVPTGRNKVESFGDLMELVSQSAENTEAARTHLFARWAGECRRSMAVARLDPDVKPLMGLRSEQWESLRGFCDDLFDEQELDFHSGIDSMLIDELAEEFFFEGSFMVVSEYLDEIASDQSHAVREAIRILADSLDEGALASAIGFLVHQQIIDASQQHLMPPFRDHPASIQHFQDVSLQISIATALICDRIGGCGSQHPLTLLRCVESSHGCINPMGFKNAVEQTLTPVEYSVFVSLYDQIRLLIVRQHNR